MHVHLLVPDLLRKDFLAPDRTRYLPADSEAAMPALPCAETIFARGRRTTISDSLFGWLAARHGLPEAALTAATSLLGDGGTPGSAAWLRADPVQLTVDRDALVLADACVFSITVDEAAALAQTINAHFAPTLAFDVITPLRWYAQLNEASPAETIQWTPVHETRGQAIQGNLPQGAAAMRWNAIANEVQMLLHEHPVNTAREGRGEPLINSLWFWGAGHIATPEARAFDQVHANDPVIRGLVQSAGGSASALPANAPEWLRIAQDSGRALVVLDGLSAPAAYADHAGWMAQAHHIEHEWLEPLLEALRHGRVGMLTVTALGSRDGSARGESGSSGVEVEVVRGDLRRFWRRIKPLASHLSLAGEHT